MTFSSIGSEEDLFETNQSSYTASVAVPDLSTNCIGFVCVNLVNSTSSTGPTGVTWNGDAMTQGPTIANGSGKLAEIWYRVNPDDNGTYDIVVSFASSLSRSISIVTGWASASNTVSLDDTSTETGTTQNPDIVSTQAEANELVVSSAVHAANALGSPIVSSCTELQSWDQGGNCTSSAYSTPSSSGDATHTHNFSQSEIYAIVSISFKEASSGINVTPTAAACIASTTAPTAVLGSLTVAMSAVTCVARVTDPTAVLGSLTVTPVIASAVASVTDPSVQITGGGESVTPTVAACIASVIDPSVVLGSLAVTPGAAASIASVTDPAILLGSVSVTPGVAASIASVVDPTVAVSGGGINVTPDISACICSVSNPGVVLGSTSATPVAAGTIARVVTPTVLVSGGAAPAAVKRGMSIGISL